MTYPRDLRERRDLALLKRYRLHGDLRAYNELVQRLMPLVKSYARKYAERGETYDDLLQVGLVGLVKAINRFDLERGNRFVSFAAPNIAGEIKRHFRDHLWAVHVPRGAQELQALVSAAAVELNRKNIEPTPAAIAKHLSIPEEQVTDGLRAADCFRAHSLDLPTGKKGDSSVLDSLIFDEPGYGQAETRVLTDYAMQALTERQQSVIRMRFEEDRIQRDIGDEIGVSQMQVCRILTTATDTMRDRLQTQAQHPEDQPLAA